MSQDVDADEIDLGDFDVNDLPDEDASAMSSIKKSSRKDKKKEKKSKKRRTEEPAKKRSRFVDDAAGESDESDGDDDDDQLDGDKGKEVVEDFEEMRANKIAEEQRKKARFYEDDEVSVDEAARRIEERYKNQREEALRGRGNHGGGEPAAAGGGGAVAVAWRLKQEARFTGSNLPRASDPKVFAVKCKPKMGRLIVTRLVYKCYCYRNGINHQRTKIDLGIISCFTLDHIKEYIYIEASRQLFVENALNGLTGVFRFNISVLDRSELMQLMEPKPIARENVNVGDFVRPKKKDSHYKGDIGQVVSVDGTRVLLKLVPREDFTDKPFNKPVTRQPQKFFSAHLAKGTQRDRDGSTMWGDLRFDAEGYILMSMPTRMLLAGPAMPPATMEEIAVFYNKDVNKVRVAAAAILPKEAAASLNQKSALHVGEIVRVVSGQLAKTIGKILDITLSSGEVKIECRIPNRPLPIVLREKLNNVAKYFSVGDHIVVEAGPLLGESGNVLQAEGETVIFLTDSAGKTEKARANECRQSRLQYASRASTSSGLKLFDLVFLSSDPSNRPMCIIKIFETDVLTLGTENNTGRYSPSLLRKSEAKQKFTTDKLSNPLKIKCEVQLSRSGMPNTTGTIVQLHFNVVFLRMPDVAKNSGIVPVSAKDVQLVGGKTSLRTIEKPRQLQQLEKKEHIATFTAEIPPPPEVNDVHSVMYADD